jgi:hypothetical protein
MTLRNRAATIALTATLLGCNPWQSINDRLLPMRGSPIDTLFAKLGYPQHEGTIAGHHFYLWQTAQTAPLPDDMSTTIGHGTVDAQSFDYTATTFGGGGIGTMRCSLRVFVDDNDRITRWDGGGNVGACLNFADRL